MLKKKCSNCGELQPLSEFRKNKLGKDGHHTKCRTCEKAYQKGYYRRPGVKERRKQWRDQRKETHPGLWAKQKLKYNLKADHGVTLEQYDQMLEDQNGVCAICGGINSDGQRLHIDHDHKTGKIRALLCRFCNIRLGYIEKDDFVPKALEYLNKYNHSEENE